jgi:hypothetical protein
MSDREKAVIFDNLKSTFEKDVTFFERLERGGDLSESGLGKLYLIKHILSLLNRESNTLEV